MKKYIIIGIVVALAILSFVFRKQIYISYMKITNKNKIILIDENKTIKNKTITYKGLLINNTKKDKKVNVLNIEFLDKNNNSLLDYNLYLDETIKVNQKKKIEFKTTIETNNIKDIENIEIEAE